jgi:hypothetical protein
MYRPTNPEDKLRHGEMTPAEHDKIVRRMLVRPFGGVVQVVTLIALLVAFAASTVGSASAAPPPRPFITGHAVPGGVLVGHPGRWPQGTGPIYYVWIVCVPPSPSGEDCILIEPPPTYPAASVLHRNFVPGTRVSFYVAFGGQLVAFDSVVIGSGS